MPVQTASDSTGTARALSNSIRTQYVEEYLDAAMAERVYDQIAAPIGRNMAELQRGSSVQVEFLSDMEPGTAAISEIVDITPQALRDTTASVTMTSRAEALQASELLLIQAFTDYGAARARKVGKNAMESIDLLAQEAALKGSNIQRYVARASLDAGTTNHNPDDGTFSEAQTTLLTMKVPGFSVGAQSVWAAIMHPAVWHEIREQGNVVSIMQYQQAEILFNYELGAIGPFRFVVSPWAKVFGGAGADNGLGVLASSLKSNANALATTAVISAAAAVHADNGKWLTIGTEETGNTFYPKNERVKWVSSTTSTITFVGEGPNGGLRFDHTTSDVVRNADSVYTICFGGPESLAKVYATEVGEFGQMVGPKRHGTVDQFESLGWKFYGAYGRLAESRVLRAEVSGRREA